MIEWRRTTLTVAARHRTTVSGGGITDPATTDASARGARARAAARRWRGRRRPRFGLRHGLWLRLGHRRRLHRGLDTAVARTSSSRSTIRAAAAFSGSIASARRASSQRAGLVATLEAAPGRARRPRSSSSGRPRRPARRGPRRGRPARRDIARSAWSRNSIIDVVRRIDPAPAAAASVGRSAPGRR